MIYQAFVVVGETEPCTNCIYSTVLTPCFYREEGREMKKEVPDLMYLHSTISVTACSFLSKKTELSTIYLSIYLSIYLDNAFAPVIIVKFCSQDLRDLRGMLLLHLFPRRSIHIWNVFNPRSHDNIQKSKRIGSQIYKFI
jgi:hypothetical protein